jgi:hypothetical protein
LTAGAMMTAMQANIKLRWLSSPKMFAEKYEIHEELLLKICDGDQNLFMNKALAKVDGNDPKFMTTEGEF